MAVGIRKYRVASYYFRSNACRIKYAETLDEHLTPAAY